MEKQRILIEKITQTEVQSGCDVCIKISIRGNSYDLIYKVRGESIINIPERIDAVVITFLIYAIKYNLDICSEYPISENLYYNIEKQISPQIMCCNPRKAFTISIKAPLTNEKFNGTWNGTGVSLGVDSFATIHEYTDDCMLDEYRLTHLVHMKVGAHFAGNDGYNSSAEESYFREENSRIDEYCKKNNYKLITVESNLHEICNYEFGRVFDTTHLVRNLGTMLLLQNYFCKYFYASAYNLDKFQIDLDKDIAHYEKWIIPLLSNENITFYSANTALSRIDKTKYISRFQDTYNYLHVCWLENDNCGKCRKCIRTLVTLDIIGELNTYKNVFDIDEYYKNRKIILNKLVAMKSDDTMYKEIYDYMKACGMKLPGHFEVFYTKAIICIETIKNYGLMYLIRRIKRLLKIGHR